MAIVQLNRSETSRWTIQTFVFWAVFDCKNIKGENLYKGNINNRISLSELDKRRYYGVRSLPSTQHCGLCLVAVSFFTHNVEIYKALGLQIKFAFQVISFQGHPKQMTSLLISWQTKTKLTLSNFFFNLQNLKVKCKSIVQFKTLIYKF